MRKIKKNIRFTNCIVIVEFKNWPAQHPWQRIDKKEVHKREIFQCSTGFLKEESPEIGGCDVSCSKTHKDEENLPEHIYDIVEISNNAKHLEDANCKQEYQVIECKCPEPVRSYLCILKQFTHLIEFNGN